MKGWRYTPQGFERTYTLEELVPRVAHEVHVGVVGEPTTMCGLSKRGEYDCGVAMRDGEVLCGECRTLSMKRYGRLP